MKKFIAIIIILSICFAFAGCVKRMTPEDYLKQIESMNNKINEENEQNSISTESSNEKPSETYVEEIEEEEPIENSLGHADLSIPNAKEYDVITWPTFGIVTKIPMPTWSDRGCFYGSETSEVTFWCNIGYTTLDDYRGYVKDLQDYGYVINVHEDPDYMFWGENEEGYGVQLTYIPWSYYMAIQVTNDPASWGAWWDED